jgi:putative oxidoreductase
MSDLKFITENEPRNAVGEWTIRIGAAVFYLVFGLEKFSNDPASHWVQLFRSIGAGNWFRYFTGAVEVSGALLVLIPRTATAGLLLLAATMASALGIVAFILHRPADSAFPGVFFLMLVGLLVWNRSK